MHHEERIVSGVPQGRHAVGLVASYQSVHSVVDELKLHFKVTVVVLLQHL